jgi:hypothetical protein
VQTRVFVRYRKNSGNTRHSKKDREARCDAPFGKISVSSLDVMNRRTIVNEGRRKASDAVSVWVRGNVLEKCIGAVLVAQIFLPSEV